MLKWRKEINTEMMMQIFFFLVTSQNHILYVSCTYEACVLLFERAEDLS